MKLYASLLATALLGAAMASPTTSDAEKAHAQLESRKYCTEYGIQCFYDDASDVCFYSWCETHWDTKQCYCPDSILTPKINADGTPSTETEVRWLKRRNCSGNTCDLPAGSWVSPNR